MRVIAIIGILLMLVIGACSQESASVSESLTGVAGICVHVAPLPAELVKAGWTIEEVRGNAEKRLQEAKLTLIDAATVQSQEELEIYQELYLPSAEFEQTRSVPATLSLHFHVAADSRRPGYLFTVNARFNQRVQIRETGRYCQATTWQFELFGCGELTDWISSVQKGLGTVIDIFITDYRAANPSEPEKATGDRAIADTIKRLNDEFTTSESEGKK